MASGVPSDNLVQLQEIFSVTTFIDAFFTGMWGFEIGMINFERLWDLKL